MHFLRLAAMASLACVVSAETARVTVLATTDLHGNLMAWDYFQAKPAERGLAKVATLIKAARVEAPQALLVDCGDTIQGSPLETVHQIAVRSGKTLQPDPMMTAMNALSFDAMVLGNHEFNYGLRNLDAARGAAKFPWLSANTHVEGGKTFAPWKVKTVNGVKVAIVGLTTPSIPSWEKPEHYRGYTFETALEAAKKTVSALRAKENPDVVIVAAHAGLERDIRTGEARTQSLPDENQIYAVAKEVPGIDAIVFGHTHQELRSGKIGDVLLVQPRNWGGSLARMDFMLERDGPRWKVASKTAQTIPVTKDVVEDLQIAAIAKPYHDAAEKYLNTPVASSAEELSARDGRIRDNALIDAIHEVQLHYAKADVSFASVFNLGAKVPRGAVTVRQLASLYIYDNQLYAVEGTGRMVRDALENSARYFDGDRFNPSVFGFNYDIAQGVEYEIDVTKPVGQRIQNLRFHGMPLADDQKLRMAVNNYRYAGSAGYTMFKDAKIVWQSPGEIRDLMVEYFTAKKSLPVKPDGNWRIVPEAAAAALQNAQQN